MNIIVIFLFKRDISSVIALLSSTIMLAGKIDQFYSYPINIKEHHHMMG